MPFWGYMAVNQAEKVSVLLREMDQIGTTAHTLCSHFTVCWKVVCTVEKTTAGREDREVKVISILNKVDKGDLTEEVTFEVRATRGELTVGLSV